jgi:lipopolysaccharide biosynthesis glycosyltransferase
MKNNNYKILNRNDEKFKNIKLNNINYNNNTNDNANILITKLIFLFLLIVSFNYRISIINRLNALEYKEIFEEEESNIYGNDLKQRKNDFWNITLIKNEMNYYSLYNQFKFPQISFLLMNNNNRKYFMETINHIKKLTSQNFSSIEIIFHTEKMNKNDLRKINNEFKTLIKSNTLKLYIKKENISDSYSSLINLSKGLYTVFIDNSSILDNIQLNQLFEYKKNNSYNIFSLSLSNNTNIYFYKTYILKNYIDNGKEFTSQKDIFTNISSLSEPKFNYIRIALCPDNRFSKLAYVSMISILSSKNYNSFICFYLIIPSNFEEHNIKFIDTLYEQYDNFNISYITMDERYQKAYTDWRITKQAYYRFSLGELLPNLNKIIYFDTDNIIYKDLTKFYNLNFNGKMILGQPSYGNKNAQRYGFHRINTGVLLLNLLEMRKNHFEKKVIEITKKRKKLRYHDQTLINDYFKQFLGIFAPEYHARPWSNINEMKIFEKKIGNVFDLDYFYFAHKYPTIRHFLGSYKPLKPNINFIEDWWYFARKSKYYNPNATTYKNAFSYK